MPIVTGAVPETDPVDPTFGLPSSDGQVSIRGLLMGRGTPYRLIEFNPFTLGVRDQDQERVDGDGSWGGNDVLTAKVVPLRVQVRANSQATWLVLHDQLVKALAPSKTDIPMVFQVGGRKVILYGRPRVLEPEVVMLGTGLVWASASFVATDPVMYSFAEHSLSTGVPSTTGGLKFPLTMPFTIDATYTSGTVNPSNLGNVDAPVTFEVDGDIVNPSITLVSSDGNPRTLAFSASVESGQKLVVSTKDRTALIGNVSRVGAMTSRQWFDLAPGANQIRFGGSGSGALTVKWSDSWA